MKQIFTIIILFLITSFATAQEHSLDCSPFHKGKFVMTGPAGGDIKIKRKKKYQYERYNREHQKYKFSIEWTSECSYTLVLQRVKGKKSAKRYEGSKVFVEITETKSDSYTARSKTEDGAITIIDIEKKF